MCLENKKFYIPLISSVKMVSALLCAQETTTLSTHDLEKGIFQEI